MNSPPAELSQSPLSVELPINLGHSHRRLNNPQAHLSRCLSNLSVKISSAALPLDVITAINWNLDLIDEILANTYSGETSWDGENAVEVLRVPRILESETGVASGYTTILPAPRMLEDAHRSSCKNATLQGDALLVSCMEDAVKELRNRQTEVRASHSLNPHDVMPDLNKLTMTYQHLHQMMISTAKKQSILILSLEQQVNQL